jgi:hypothetical protein
METKLIIKHPVSGEINLQVAIKDFENPMTWESANIFCVDLGDGWRLPTIEEMKEINSTLKNSYSSKIQNKIYWSKEDIDISHARCFNFYNGSEEDREYYQRKTTKNNVRAVRIINLS